jgi:hypothetical protein
MIRKFVIGDVRGELSLLKRLLDKIGPTSNDQVIFTGSYVGPGEDSKGTVDYLLSLKKDLNLVCLRGCFEFMFGLCIETQPAPATIRLWGDMGGRRVLNSYASGKSIAFKDDVHSNLAEISASKLREVKDSLDVKKDGRYFTAEVEMCVPLEHLSFFADQHQWFEDDVYPFIVTHCGAHPVLFGGQIPNEEATVFSEKNWWEDDGRRIPGKTVIFSHVPFKQPLVKPGKLGIDLGAGLGGCLCCFELYEHKFTIASPI